MTRQEKIREHLIELFEQTPNEEESGKLVDAVLWVLNEDGVVLKVERELPEPACCPEFAKCHEFCHTIEQCNMLKTGYVAVESLIKE